MAVLFFVGGFCASFCVGLGHAQRGGCNKQHAMRVELSKKEMGMGEEEKGSMKKRKRFTLRELWSLEKRRETNLTQRSFTVIFTK